jgi:hypothetical protein
MKPMFTHIKREEFRKSLHEKRELWGCGGVMERWPIPSIGAVNSGEYTERRDEDCHANGS